MNKNTIIFISILSLFFIDRLFSQCYYPNLNYSINDDTICYQFIVDGADMNDLSNINQGVCLVDLKFMHQFIGDIYIELISPANQSLVLVGPSGSSNTTFGTTWDISFVSCGSGSASPDIGFPDIWDSSLSWGNLGSYSGSYYPNEACLEAFNMGTVNGTWTLKIYDTSQFGVGVLKDFGIVFCDDSGISCFECAIPDFSISINQDSFCNIDLDQQISIAVDSLGSLNINEYNFEYLLFHDDSLIQKASNVNFTTIESGGYTICGLVYSLIDSTGIANLPNNISPFDWNNLISENQFCASTSESCLDFEVFKPDTLLYNKTICAGDSVLFGGVFVKEPDTYLNIISGPICDTLEVLTLDLIDIAVSFNVNDLVVDCGDSITIIANLNIPINEVEFLWTTINGNIISAVNQQNIIVDSGGDYYLQISSDGCLHHDTISLIDNKIIPNINFTSSNLNCDSSSVLIDLESQLSLNGILWSSNEPFTLEGEDIRVNVPGTFTVEVTADNGCSNSKSITIIEDYNLPEFNFNIANIDCINDSVQVMGQFLNPSLIDSFYWEGVVPLYKDSLLPLVFTEGEINLIAIGNNGCRDTLDLDVADNRYIPDFEVTPDTLTCTKPQVILSISSGFDISEVSWILPNNQVENSDIITTNLPGKYNITITDINGCQNTGEYQLVEDTSVISIVVNNIDLPCGTDSVQLSFIASNYESIFWEGPGTFESSDTFPFVSETGIYELTITNFNGCESTEQVLVIEDASLPSFTFIADTISCSNPISDITPNDTVGYIFIWEGQSTINDTTNVFSTDIEGDYLVTVVDTLNDCRSTYDISVISEINYSTFELQSGVLDCNQSSTFIEVVNHSGTIASGEWTGAGIVTSTNTSLQVNLPGIYIANITNNEGCITTDSILVILDDSLPEIFVSDATITCMMDFVTVTASTTSSGNSFTWYEDLIPIGNDSSVTLFNPGEYYLDVEGTNGCIKRDTIRVFEDNNIPNVNILFEDTLTCQLLEIDLQAEVNIPGGTFIWYSQNQIIGNGANITVFEPGFYSVQYSTSSGCVGSDTIEIISKQDYIEFVNITADTISCNEPTGNVSLEIVGDFNNIIWSGPSLVPEGLLSFNTDTAGLYGANIISPLGCSTTVFINVIGDTISPKINNILVDNITCKQPIVIATAILDGNINSLLWEGNGFLQNGNEVAIESSGSYQLTVEDINGCTSISSFEVSADTLGPIFTYVIDTLSCGKGKANVNLVTSSEIQSISWSGPSDYMANSQDIVVIEPGFYTYYAIDNNGCRTIDSVEIVTNYRVPEVSFSGNFTLNCDSIPIQLQIDSDIPIIKYRWIGPNNFFSNLSNPLILETGTYTISVASTSDCFSEPYEFEVLYDGELPQFQILGDTIYCDPAIAELQLLEISDDRNVSWCFNNSEVSNTFNLITTVSGLYTAKVTGINGCVDSMTYLLLVDTIKPQIVIPNEVYFECGSFSTVIDASFSSSGPEFDYEWTTINGQILGSVNVSMPIIQSSGTYSLNILNTISGCESDYDVLVTSSPSDLSGVVLDIGITKCEYSEDGYIEVLDIVNGHKPFEVAFELFTFSDKYLYEKLSAGEYLIKIKDSAGCIIDTIVTVGVGENINADIVGDTLINLGDKSELSAIISIPISKVDSLVWNVDSIDCIDCFNISVYPTRNTLYSYKVISEDGCIDSAEILVRVIQDPRLKLPNIFSPNGDNVNDFIIYPPFTSVEKVIDFKIFDNWGSLIFEAKDFDPTQDFISWDGSFNGKRLNPGVFVYLNTVLLKNGEIVTTSGNITLIR